MVHFPNTTGDTASGTSCSRGTIQLCDVETEAERGTSTARLLTDAAWTDTCPSCKEPMQCGVTKGDD